MELGIIGVGRMGSAIAAGLIERRIFSPGELLVFDLDRERARAFSAAYGPAAAASAADLVRGCRSVLLAVKPQDRSAALEPIGAIGIEGPLISILAGVPTSALESIRPGLRVIRVMPNLGVRVGAGLSFYCAGRNGRESDRVLAARIFGGLGEAFEIDESLMNAVTALSGSGPAYFFRLMEIMAGFGRAAGLAPEVAAKLASRTALAAALLARDGDPAALRGEVTSRGGTTEAAFRVLEEGNLSGLFESALAAAVKRGRELAEGR
ncbi:MAG TPA: pyrroline-5-carboxylate reductase [bacterium]|uniref:Pyrroline-5-carboxylate reductase n=1 Tax=candidate division TA06 bacterium ADurb.Bin417 TaxID=1852828 RepID=A0A1V5MFN7_UNCT6|nr:MAG: Pyrroline-5-carboxylate reductase [candidate division TA06 bacterium ADurb.Bin417]HNQ34693.1 pyrroline-5-carboxylate reductase [bacterium]HNS48066.1 pyrroline-5-carboxylate reductase [bacterium]